MKQFFGNEEFAPVIIERLFPNSHIGAYFPSLFYFSVMVIIIALIIEIILDQKTAFMVLSSFIFPLFLTIIMTTALCIEKVNLLQLWAIFYFCILICLHSTFKKIILYSESVGSYANLKLIKGFFLTVKNTVSGAISTGIRGFNNPIDEITVLLVLTMVLLLDVMVFISCIIYLFIHWRLIFLSYLINSF
ncbi:MAG: hypothetical protein LBB81_10415 [Treponema sp.]|nr:hypothetical protein [Treponema sp.]